MGVLMGSSMGEGRVYRILFSDDLVLFEGDVERLRDIMLRFSKIDLFNFIVMLLDKESFKGQGTVNVNKILLAFTRDYPVSTRAVLRRLEMYCKAWNLEIVGDFMRRKTEVDVNDCRHS